MLCVDNGQLSAVKRKFSFWRPHKKHCFLQACSVPYFPLFTPTRATVPKTFESTGLITAADNAVINVQQSLHTMKPSSSSRWLSSFTWHSLRISQHSYRRWEAGQCPTSFQEGRKYSANWVQHYPIKCRCLWYRRHYYLSIYLPMVSHFRWILENIFMPVLSFSAEKSVMGEITEAGRGKPNLNMLCRPVCQASIKEQAKWISPSDSYAGSLYAAQKSVFQLPQVKIAENVKAWKGSTLNRVTLGGFLLALLLHTWK